MTERVSIEWEDISQEESRALSHALRYTVRSLPATYELEVLIRPSEWLSVRVSIHERPFWSHSVDGAGMTLSEMILEAAGMAMERERKKPVARPGEIEAIRALADKICNQVVKQIEDKTDSKPRTLFTQKMLLGLYLVHIVDYLEHRAPELKPW